MFFVCLFFCNLLLSGFSNRRTSYISSTDGSPCSRVTIRTWASQEHPIPYKFPVVLFSLKHRRGHPEQLFIFIIPKIKSGPKYPKNSAFNFENRSNACNPYALWAEHTCLVSGWSRPGHKPGPKQRTVGRSGLSGWSGRSIMIQLPICLFRSGLTLQHPIAGELSVWTSHWVSAQPG